MSAATAPKTPVTVPTQLRIPVAQRLVIDRAANASGKTRTEFMVDSSVRAAEDVLVDQRVFVFDDDAYSKFTEYLDAPGRPNERLRDFFQIDPVWEK